MGATIHDPRAPSLNVYDFLARHADGSTAPQLERTYYLPALASGYYPISVITRSDPSPSSFPQSLKSCGRPFYTMPTSRLLAISLDFMAYLSDRSWSYVLFVHHTSLLHGLESESMRGQLLKVVSWENWGPTQTRLIRTNFNEPTWVCYVHGTRYVRLAPLNPTAVEMSPSHLHVLDFNLLAPRRGEFKRIAFGQNGFNRSLL